MGLEKSEDHYPLTIEPSPLFGLSGAYRQKQATDSVDAVEIILTRRELEQLIRAKYEAVHGILSGYYDKGRLVIP